MVITSLKTSAEISAATNPWWVFHPTLLSNYVGLLTSNQFLTFFRNSAFVSIFVVTITMLIQRAAAFALSRMRFWGSGPRHRSFSDLSDPGYAVVSALFRCSPCSTTGPAFSSSTVGTCFCCSIRH